MRFPVKRAAALGIGAALAAAAPASAAVKNYWVAAVPVTWNIVRSIR